MPKPIPLCAHCGKPCKSPIRKYCGHDCAGKGAAIARGRAWEPDAVAWIEENTGFHQPSELYRVFCSAARNSGWATRTQHQLFCKVRELGLSRRADLDNWSLNTMCNTLGIEKRKAARWQRKGLTFRRSGAQRHTFSIKRIAAFLIEHPDEAVGITDDALLSLGIEARDKILELRPKYCKRRGDTALRHRVTGQIFPSIERAAIAYSLCPSTLATQLRNGRGRLLEVFEKV